MKSGHRSAPIGAGGFSLVELSIVLVILGLLTGGILTGQNLIRAAELRSVITEYQSYQTAVMTFRDKYFALPGDMTNATAFWGTMTNCGAASPSGTGAQTCSGNGDGVINQPAAASQTGEMFTFWQHLANAELIAGSYSGIAGGGGSQHNLLGVNAPKSKLSNAGWDVSWAGNYAGTSTTYAYDYGNRYSFGGPTSNGIFLEPILTPTELWNIDTKIDDGVPSRGRIIARYWGTTVADNACTVNASSKTDLDSDYDLSYNSIACAILFAQAF